MQNGWIKLHRKMLESEDVAALTPTQRWVFVAYLMAADRQHEIGTLNKLVDDDRVPLNIREKAALAGVSIGAITTAENAMQQAGLISVDNRRKIPLKITNYERYQSVQQMNTESGGCSANERNRSLNEQKCLANEHRNSDEQCSANEQRDARRLDTTGVEAGANSPDDRSANELARAREVGEVKEVQDSPQTPRRLESGNDNANDEPIDGDSGREARLQEAQFDGLMDALKEHTSFELAKRKDWADSLEIAISEDQTPVSQDQIMTALEENPPSITDRHLPERWLVEQFDEISESGTEEDGIAGYDY